MILTDSEIRSARDILEALSLAGHVTLSTSARETLAEAAELLGWLVRQGEFRAEVMAS